MTDGGYEELCEAGRLAAQNMDEGRWIIGDLSLLVQKEYGQNTIERFAKDINVEVKRVREYRTVCRFYDIPQRQKLLQDFPTLSYSHFRMAMKLGELDKAVTFLEECGTNAYTVEHASVKVKGGNAPQKLLDAEVGLRHVDLESGVIAFQVAPGADLSHLSKHVNKVLRVQIHALESEETNGRN